MAAKKVAQQDVGALERAKRFLRNVWAELKKVHWLDKTQLIKYTGVVLTAVVIIAVLLWVIDSGLGFLIQLIF
ncbi:preprotein translocase subunit SecE [Desulfitispora alkaliphila]|uniref:preprotein translocase subunit SecE n=1 Tax=Desulfitispora alkaliphila TaxID=622674 RepID=UPI003D1DC617